MILHEPNYHGLQVFHDLNAMVAALGINGPVESKDLPAGIKIAVMDPEAMPVLLMETKARTSVICIKFGMGYSSDNWLIFNDNDGSYYVLFNEPVDLSSTGEEIPESEAFELLQEAHEMGYDLRYPDWIVFACQ